MMASGMMSVCVVPWRGPPRRRCNVAASPASPESAREVPPELPLGGNVAGGLSASWVASVREAHAGDDASLTSLLLPHAQRLAVPPVSRFPVGAVGLGESGRMYLGANLELAGLPLSHSVHAEQALVASVMRAGETRLTWVATTAPPCGHCRQFLNELGGSDGLRLVTPGVGFQGSSHDNKGLTLPMLLPHRFGPEDLLGGGHRGLLSHGPLKAVLEVGDLQSDSDRWGAGEEAREEARAAAFAAATLSYAPYTKCPSGAAVVLADGRVFSGSYVECAAYNPSLPPLQAALSAAVIDGRCLTPPPGDGGQGDGEGGGRPRGEGSVDWASPSSPTRVVHACVVERTDGAISQASTVRMVLGEIAPGCSLEVCGLAVCDSGAGV